MGKHNDNHCSLFRSIKRLHSQILQSQDSHRLMVFNRRFLYAWHWLAYWMVVIGVARGWDMLVYGKALKRILGGLELQYTIMATWRAQCCERLYWKYNTWKPSPRPLHVVAQITSCVLTRMLELRSYISLGLCPNCKFTSSIAFEQCLFACKE